MQERVPLVEVEDVVREEIVRAGVPGASIALITDGEEVFRVAVGLQGPGRYPPIGTDDRFLLYSITKTLVAIAVMRMVEQGRIELDEPAGRVLHGYGLNEGVTFRRLLNHTSGIGDYGDMPEYAADLKRHPEQPWTVDAFLERVLSKGPLFRPGDGWAYSNVGYLLLRLAVEHVEAATLREVLDAVVFAPLGLRCTTVVERLEDTRELTPAWSGQLDDDGQARDISRRYHPGWVSHGVVMSTAPETARIVEALFGGRLVRPDSLRAMLTAVEVSASHPLVGSPGYGLGLMIDRDTARWRTAGHAGGGPGYSTAAFHFAMRDGSRLTCVALANGDAGDVGMRIVFALAERWSAAAGKHCCA